MATERLSMRQTRQILRQKWSLGRTHREVAQSLGISCGAVGTTVLRARAAGLDWAQVDTLSDEVLQARTGPRPHPRIIGPFPTAPTCMPSGASPASRSSCCISNISNSTRTATAIPSRGDRFRKYASICERPSAVRQK